MPHWMMPISVSIAPQPDISLHCETTYMQLVHHMEYLFTLWLLLIHMAPMHGQMNGWVNLSYWLHTEVVCPNTADYPARY